MTPLRSLFTGVMVAGLATSGLVVGLTGLTAAGASTAHADDASSPADPYRSSLHVATRSHVDAPKTYWENNNFVLYSEVGRTKRPLENTINWVGKGWHNRTRKPNYQFEVPSDSWARFLGKEGELLYLAPAVPGSSNSPIWAGFGADTAIPTDRFVGGAFVLDVMHVDGPGRMEMFNPGLVGASRLLSSHDVGYRSAWLQAGTHTHNETTFTSPGRYAVTYQVRARTKDGQLIVSKPTTLQWQVGGAYPDLDLTTLPERFAKAPSTRTDGASQNFAFTIKPHVVGEDAQKGDKFLSDLVIETGVRSDKGTAIVYVNGYFLTEIPVKDGRGQWSELLGDHDARYQVAYLPADGTAGAKWLSEVVTYKRGDQSITTRTTGTSFHAKETTDAAATLTGDEYTPASRDVTVTLTPQASEGSESSVLSSDPATIISVKLPDPRMRAHVVGGVYETADAPNPSCLIDDVVSAQHPQFPVDLSLCKGGHLKLSVVAHPLAKVGDAKVTAADLDVTKTLTLSAKFGELKGAHAGAGEPGAGAGASGSGDSAAPGAAGDGNGSGSGAAGDAPAGGVLTDPVTLSSGHMDVRLTDEAGPLAVLLKDDSGTVAHSSVLRDLRAVTFSVPPTARMARPARAADPSFDVLGPVGSKSYILPETNVPGLLWLGFSTETLNYTAYPAGVDFRASLVSGPAKGRFAFYQTEDFGQRARVLFSGGHEAERFPASGLHTEAPTHLHGAWAFTAPGTYEIKVDAVAGETTLGSATLRFVVASQDAAPVTIPASAAAGTDPNRDVPTSSPSAPGAVYHAGAASQPAGSVTAVTAAHTTAGIAPAGMGQSPAGTGTLPATGVSGNLGLIVGLIAAGLVLVIGQRTLLKRQPR